MFDLDAEVSRVGNLGLYTTIYTDYNDELTDEQVSMILLGETNTYSILGDEVIYNLYEYAYSNYGGGSVISYEIGQLPWSDEFLSAAGEWYEEIYDDELPTDTSDLGNAIQEFLNDQGYSTSEYAPDIDFDQYLKDLARNTPAPLVVTTVSKYSDFVGEALDEDEMFDAKVDFVAKALARVGVTMSEDALYETVANGPYDFHEGVTVELAYRADISQVLEAGGSCSVSINNPSILFIDRWNGSGWDGEASGTASFTTSPSGSFRMELDKGNGYDWQDIAGVSAGSYPEADIS